MGRIWIVAGRLVNQSFCVLQKSVSKLPPFRVFDHDGYCRGMIVDPELAIIEVVASQ